MGRFCTTEEIADMAAWVVSPLFLHHRTDLRPHRRKSHLLMENLTLEELCVHQVCIWKKSSFRESLECMARNGVFKTAVWKPCWMRPS